jgi:Lon protease-like protein
MAQLLPLFPLEMVLFPGVGVPLHIFEPRYKEMIGECIEQHGSFGIVRAQETSLSSVGCSAEVVNVVKRYDDGRLDIIAGGVRRFELIEVDQERSFLRGDVRFFDDDAGSAPRSQVEKALGLHKQTLALLGAETEPPETDSPNFTFQLAAGLPTDLDFKQALLTMRSEDERLSTLLEYYEAIIPRLEKMRVARKRAGGNGHVH